MTILTLVAGFFLLVAVLLIVYLTWLVREWNKRDKEREQIGKG